MELDIVRQTQPELVHGADLLDRPVRWVHTSELAEVPSLLKGGELLLTTGLGLADHGRVAQATYVHQLADKGLAALALELGWTFDVVPEGLMEAARECDLPLIALHAVVPFVEITEQIQARIVHRQATKLRLERDVQTRLNEILLRDEGLSGIVNALSEMLACPVVVRTVTGQIAAVAGVADIGAMPTEPPEGTAGAPVRILDEHWGTLEVLGTSAHAGPLARAVLDLGPTAIALTLLGRREAVPRRRRVSRELLEDLLAGRFRSRRDLEARAALAGFTPPLQHRLVAVAVGAYVPEDAEIAAYATATAVAEMGGGLVAEVEAIVLGVLGVDAVHETQALADRLHARIHELMLKRGASRPPLLALGSLSDGVESLGRSLRDAQSTLALATELRPGKRAVTARGMATDRLLAKLVDERELSGLVEDEIGELLRYDAAHGTQLAGTLRAYLTSGSSKSELARSLHLRRQSLYKRLSTIDRLVGGGLDDPERRVSLIIALKAGDVLDRHAASHHVVPSGLS